MVTEFLHSKMTSYTSDLCRDRYGLFNATVFQLWTCSLCYNYIFHGRPLRNVAQLHHMDDVTGPLGHHVPRDIVLYKDLIQDISMTESSVCRQLGMEGCKKLERCCQNAVSCCRSQTRSRLTVGHSPDNIGGSRDLPKCPSTWDGFACFQETVAGHSAEILCPSYIDHKTTDDGVALKTCTENGTWWVDPYTGREWTDYTGCVSLKEFKPLYVVGITSNVISILLLIPSCVIFISFKQLRRQHRIRIHLNLFTSFILTNCAMLGWDIAVFRDRAEGNNSSSIMQEYTSLCRMLYIVTRYSWACNFFWMSLEGFHLYRLINQAFKTPKSITQYYFIGWLAPCIPMFVYCFCRLWNLHSGCWIHHAGFLEWIVYGPNLMCIILNVAFLINVLRILLTQIQTHPNEPSNYRRALKATFILVPLFGIQLFLIVYRPYDDITANIFYEVIAKIIGNSQGAAVAIVFCFLNSEVMGLFCNSGTIGQNPNSNFEFRSYTYTTNGEHRLDQTRMSNDVTTESYQLKSPRGGYGRREVMGFFCNSGTIGQIYNSNFEFRSYTYSTNGERRLYQTRMSNDVTTESYQLKSPRGGYGRREVRVDSPVHSINWKGGSDSSKIHMI